MIVGLALALACAVATSVAFLLKQRGAVLAPPVRGQHPLRSAADLFRSRWFAVGWAVAVGAWALHVGALALAPLSIVQAVLAGGIVFLAVFAERYFGFRLGKRQWIGVIVTAVGLAIIGLTSGGGDGEPPHYAVAALIAIECGVLVVGVGVAVFATHHRVPLAAQGLLLGTAAGALFGVSDIGIKFLADDIASGVLELISPWTVTALIASVVAFYASARGLQIGPGRRGHRPDLDCRQPHRDRRRHSHLPGSGRERSARDHRTDARLLPRARGGRPDPRPGPSRRDRPYLGGKCVRRPPSSGAPRSRYARLIRKLWPHDGWRNFAFRGFSCQPPPSRPLGDCRNLRNCWLAAGQLIRLTVIT